MFECVCVRAETASRLAGYTCRLMMVLQSMSFFIRVFCSEGCMMYWIVLWYAVSHCLKSECVIAYSTVCVCVCVCVIAYSTVCVCVCVCMCVQSMARV